MKIDNCGKETFLKEKEFKVENKLENAAIGDLTFLGAFKQVCSGFAGIWQSETDTVVHCQDQMNTPQVLPVARMWTSFSTQWEWKEESDKRTFLQLKLQK